MSKDKSIERENARRLASEFAERGDYFGWFDAFYKEAAGDNERIPWGDLEPNPFFKKWAENNAMRGDGRKALVVGCGLGDDARYLYDLGFKVTAFDISGTAIEWARKLHRDTDIEFQVGDLFEPPEAWVWAKKPSATADGSDKTGGFEFVLEIYTIQPLPIEMRPQVIDAIAAFVAPGGQLVVVTRGREDNEEPEQLPWPLSRKDLRRFKENELREIDFHEMFDDDGERRFVVEYIREAGDK